MRAGLRDWSVEGVSWEVGGGEGVGGILITSVLLFAWSRLRFVSVRFLANSLVPDKIIYALLMVNFIVDIILISTHYFSAWSRLKFFIVDSVAFVVGVVACGTLITSALLSAWSWLGLKLLISEWFLTRSSVCDYACSVLGIVGIVGDVV